MKFEQNRQVPTTDQEYCLQAMTRMVGEYSWDEPHDPNPFVSGLIEKIRTMNLATIAAAAGLMKLALRNDPLGERVRREVFTSESCLEGEMTITPEEQREAYFWNGIINGLALADTQLGQKPANDLL